MNIRVIREHCISDMVQQRRLPRARRGDNETTRALADGRDNVDHPRGDPSGTVSNRYGSLD